MSTNQVWLVTGASGGLGLATVKELLAAGYRVAATTRDVEKLRATKAALILLTEAVDAEERDFNVRATAVCPGGLRTDFLGGSARFPQAPIAAYRSVREHEQRYRQLNQNQSGDPVKAARALMSFAESADPPGRIYLGVDSFAAIGRKLQAVADEAQAWRALSLSPHYED